MLIKRVYMLISDFYANDYVDYSSYSNLRAIGSAVDGFKNTARKIACTVMEKNIKNEIKVSQLSSKMAEHTEYLHGDASGVIVTMVQDFTGTNNLSLMDTGGAFGTRLIPEASAPRYIFTNGSKVMWETFNKDDEAILVQQTFEGDRIEPQFYLPNMPLLLCNGSEGISSGFAQKILPRDPKAIKRYLLLNLKLDNPFAKPFNTKPHWNGFKGTVTQNVEKNKWLVKGVATRINTTTVDITELPIGYSLKTYIKVLEELETLGKIVTYKDKSDDEDFLFEVKYNRAYLKGLSEEALYKELKLIKPITENYTAMLANNTVHIFSGVSDIMSYYIDVKMEYLQNRKVYLTAKIADDIRLDVSKYLFIKKITEDELIVSKRKKEVIIKDLDMYPKILKRDESYDYLLSMPISSLTKERMDKLVIEIKEKKARLDMVKKQTLQEMWIEDLV